MSMLRTALAEMLDEQCSAASNDVHTAVINTMFDSIISNTKESLSILTREIETIEMANELDNALDILARYCLVQFQSREISYIESSDDRNIACILKRDILPRLCDILHQK